MKIIENNFKGYKCKQCGSLVSPDLSDFIKSRQYVPPLFYCKKYFICPCCKHQVVVSSWSE